MALRVFLFEIVCSLEDTAGLIDERGLRAFKKRERRNRMGKRNEKDKEKVN